MFESSLIESADLLRTNNRKPAMISAVAQFLAVAAIVALPLLHPETIAHRIDVLHAISMPIPPPPIPPPPVHVRVVPTVEPANHVSVPVPARPRIERPTATNEPPPSTVGLNLSNNTNSFADNPLSSLGTGGPASPHITVASGTPSGTGSGIPTNSRPATISTGVSAGLLLEPIRPSYPAIARMAHVSGTVQVEALISTTGRIESAHATSGPAMLQPAALEAVRLARYRPFLLNGRPTEVNATFSINFTLNQ